MDTHTPLAYCLPDFNPELRVLKHYTINTTRTEYKKETEAKASVSLLHLMKGRIRSLSVFRSSLSRFFRFQDWLEPVHFGFQNVSQHNHTD